MDKQKYLNSYIFAGLTEMLKNFNIDGEPKRVTRIEVAKALQCASERITNEIPLDFTGRQ